MIDLDTLKEFVDYKVENNFVKDISFLLKKHYLPGKEVIATIVSIQSYGIFVEFDMGGKGLIHVSNFCGVSKDYLNECEEGDWVIARIIQFSDSHKRFRMELVETDAQ